MSLAAMFLTHCLEQAIRDKTRYKNAFRLSWQEKERSQKTIGECSKLSLLHCYKKPNEHRRKFVLVGTQ